MKVYGRFTKVTIDVTGSYNTTTCHGLIKAVWIEGDSIQYKVSYFYSGTHHEVWLSEEEFTTKEEKNLQIGFKS